MNRSAATTEQDAGRTAPALALDAFCRSVLLAIGCDDDTADAATRAMMHGSRLGVDSHGVRLLDHYVGVIKGGRVKGRPTIRIEAGLGAVALIDAGDGHGALGAYRGMDHACDLADRFGIGAVGIASSSHFGPAGAYALAAAERDMIGMAFCNSDSFVRLHDGAMRFHGTNPIACAVPVEGERPWLLDMATSAIPYNRIQLYKSLGIDLPEGVASAADGGDTTNAEDAEMLAPLGGDFGFKGAGLAGLVEILTAVLTGMKLSFDIAAMGGPDLSTPRKLGAFVLALRPDAMAGREAFRAGMRRYLDTLRASPSRPGRRVMAPGDREWAEAARRKVEGIPLDPTTTAAFERLAKELGLDPPWAANGRG